MLEKVIYYDKRPPHIEKLLIEYAKPGIDLKFYEPSYGEAGSLEEAEAILAHSRGVTREIIDRAPNLKIIQVASVGYNQHDIEYAREKGIYVCNCAGGASDCVAEMVIGLMLSLTRRITQLSEKVRQGEWHNWTYRHDTHTIIGKTLGVIGLGAIGVLVANAALDLGMDVIGYDPFLTLEAAWHLSASVDKAETLEELVSKSDYITIHIPLNDKTRNTFDEKLFAVTKKGARLLNFARGGLVDNEALKDAIEKGIIARYITDFPDETLLGNENIIVLPHLGASTPEAEDNCAVMAAQEIYDYLKNGNIKNSVNMPNAALERLGACRLCVIHRNVPNMINSILDLVSARNLNVEHMINKPRGEFAYTMMDLSEPVGSEITAPIEQNPDVLRVRVI